MPNYYQNLMNMISDKADPDDTQGVKPVMSPIDFAVAGIPGMARQAAASIPRVAGSDAASLARQAALSKIMNPQVQAFQDNGTVTPKISLADIQGNKAIDAMSQREASVLPQLRNFANNLKNSDLNDTQKSVDLLNSRDAYSRALDNAGIKNAIEGSSTPYNPIQPSDEPTLSEEDASKLMNMLRNNRGRN